MPFKYEEKGRKAAEFANTSNISITELATAFGMNGQTLREVVENLQAVEAIQVVSVVKPTCGKVKAIQVSAIPIIVQAIRVLRHIVTDHPIYLWAQKIDPTNFDIEIIPETQEGGNSPQKGGPIRRVTYNQQ